MKFLLDFFPIALFFAAYKLGDIYIATLTAILASVLQVGWSRYKTGRFEKLPLITLATLVVLGSATLFLRNELFIKWKPTALYWLLALVFFATQYIGKKPLVERLMESNMHLKLSRKTWMSFNFSWVLFFTLMGSLNLYVVYHYDTNTWVNFKLFGTLALTFLFVVLQGLYLKKYFKEQDNE